MIVVRGRSSRVEQAAHNRLVEGSNPSDPTKFLDAVVRNRLPDENVGVRHGFWRNELYTFPDSSDA